MDKLVAQNVAIRYHNKHSATDHLAVGNASFAVQEGMFASIIGRSGSGKSSLLRAIAGLIPYSGGSLSLAGKPISRPGPDRAVVFQSARLLPWRTVSRNVSYGLELQGMKKETSRERAARAIDLVGLTEVAHSYPATLSGGMQQRVNLARALAFDPDLLLLDEPFSALDAQTRESMGNELLRVWAMTRKTSVFITHQIDEAVFLSDRVIVLSAGPASTTTRVIDIDLPRPRTPGTRDLPRFTEYVHTLRAEISGE
ncbi:ABC transporter ATP-binding protein [Streptomyces sp. NPDC050560]|uniref:ABC transporter ATP-binding protein n=1 Tax=Streptomyces sp. NPDC050560 TaxID=3365630 RepID=UPI0037BDDF62